MKTINITLSIIGLLMTAYALKEKKTGIKCKFENNLTKELDKICNSDLSIDNVNIDYVLNEHGFLKTGFDRLNENGKLNYSLSKGYI